MDFSRLEVQNWRQFRSIDLQIHDRATIITGANGAGKTTLLNILGRHFGWNVQFIATSRLSKRGVFQYYSGFYEEFEPEAQPSQTRSVGTITYSSGFVSRIIVPEEVNPAFDISIENQQPVDGVFLPSHRPIYSFQKVEHIPTEIDANAQLFERYYANLRSAYLPSRRVESPSYQLKASLISLATFGYGNLAVRKSDQAIATFEGFQEVLRRVLPPKLEFDHIEVRIPDVVFVCGTGDFSLDASSGGVSAIVDMAWQLYMKSLLSASFVAIIDEPENHLHPEMQRTLLPGFVSAFPMVQLIVATHNPFVVTSMRDSSVYVLDYVDGKVESSTLSNIDRSASANQVLTDVLGVTVPIPIWVEEEIASIVREFESLTLNDDTLLKLRNRLKQVGLGHVFPESVGKLSEKRDAG